MPRQRSIPSKTAYSAKNDSRTPTKSYQQYKRGFRSSNNKNFIPYGSGTSSYHKNSRHQNYYRPRFSNRRHYNNNNPFVPRSHHHIPSWNTRTKTPRLASSYSNNAVTYNREFGERRSNGYDHRHHASKRSRENQIPSPAPLVEQPLLASMDQSLTPSLIVNAAANYAPTASDQRHTPQVKSSDSETRQLSPESSMEIRESSNLDKNVCIGVLVQTLYSGPQLSKYISNM
uniref:Uncharacterized protein n=1 Tax=Panagrolaimus sp. ES5 TaxID=591445 RepID=A0AC34F5B0_9BILA